MFYNTTSAGVQRDSTGTRGIVNCELLQTTDFGRSWSRVAQEGVQFIPRGEPGSFDSNTLCKICKSRLSPCEGCQASEREGVADTAWTGDQNALLDPQNNDTTLFYYSGKMPRYRWRLHSSQDASDIVADRRQWSALRPARRLHRPRPLADARLRRP